MNLYTKERHLEINKQLHTEHLNDNHDNIPKFGCIECIKLKRKVQNDKFYYLIKEHNKKWNYNE